MAVISACSQIPMHQERNSPKVPEAYAKLVCDAVKEVRRRDVISAWLTCLRPQAGSQEVTSPPGWDIQPTGWTRRECGVVR